MIGKYPTPVHKLAELGTTRTELWVKRDDRTNDIYGGNKIRKLEHIFAEARKRGARRLLTLAPAGSHQAPATAVHGRRAGFAVAAVLTPQFRTAYAVDNLRVALAAGLEAFAASSVAAVPIALARAHRRDDFFIAPGGTTVAGTLGYVDAALELEEQVKSGALPRPDAVVVPLGSGGTVAGLLAGFVEVGFETKVIGVRIVHPALMGRQRTLSIATRVSHERGHRPDRRKFSSMLEVDRSQLGPGYGRPSPAGRRATEEAAHEGLALDDTYTAKTFAAALSAVHSGRFGRVLYWHTRPETPLTELLGDAPPLPSELSSLFPVA